MRTVDANTLSGSARDTAGSTSSCANVVHCLVKDLFSGYRPRAALHAWPRPEMARPSSALVNVRFLKPYRRAGGTSYHQSVIIRWNNLMQLPEFTRSTTLRWSSPAWPYLLWLWSELSASRYCGQPLIFLFLADVAAALVRLAAASRPLRVSRHHVAGRRRK